MSSFRVLVCTSPILAHEIGSMLAQAADIMFELCPGLNPADLVQTARQFQPQLILLEDTALFKPTLLVLEQLRAELTNVKVVIIARDAQHARALLDAGVKAFLLTPCIQEDLITSLRLVAAGKVILSPQVAQSLLTHYS